MRMPRGTGGRPHSHPNEQWIYVMQGTLECEVDGVKSRVPSGSLVYVPTDVVHSALATAEEDVTFLTAKDMSHGIVGTPVDTSISTPLYAPEPKKLVLLPGGHFDAYVRDFDAASGAARDWFVQHLGVT